MSKRVTLLVITPYLVETDDKGRIVAGPSPVYNQGSQQPITINVNEAQLQDWEWPVEFAKGLEMMVASPETEKVHTNGRKKR